MKHIDEMNSQELRKAAARYDGAYNPYAVRLAELNLGTATQDEIEERAARKAKMDAAVNMPPKCHGYLPLDQI